MSLAPLKDYINNVVRVITIDGRTYQGTLLAVDNSTNLILTGAEERVIQPPDSDEPNTISEPQVLLVRGDLVLVCALVDEDVDSEIDWLKVRGGPIGSTKHV
ncbi:uncharacterized protein PV09_05430 [Verruconis gallopava]|uniref:LSM2-LSM8 complex subunit LSM8 n=1 Tax=Verruconis gallopava TaxID=253628 RepID=A0A0D2AVM6_9PEZI|nr:uncharacterized protein PV09_05430 [Verruconis gallopava]KIW03204.1 hypothetical protein PV09_05430 [Verruconis gallopava]